MDQHVMKASSHPLSEVLGDVHLELALLLEAQLLPYASGVLHL